MSDSKIARHKKYRRQCKVRIRSGLQLTAIGALIAAALVWHDRTLWPLAAASVAIPAGITTLETSSTSVMIAR